MGKVSCFSLLLVLLVVHESQSLIGFDISLQDCNDEFYQDSVWRCFADEGYGFAVIQAVQGGNGMTKEIVSCVQGAARNGFAVSLYGWFCPNCYQQGNGYDTAYDVISSLSSLDINPGVNYTYFYIDVESCDPYDECWGLPSENEQYLLDIVSGAKDAGASVGIYSSDYEWKLLFGSDSWSSPSLTALPLWYANWNNVPGMTGFSPFGGWTSPHMHQYADYCYYCYNVDQDFIY